MAFSLSGCFSSHSRSSVKPAGASLVLSQSAMAVAGDSVVCSALSFSPPPSSSDSRVSTPSARFMLLVSTMTSLAATSSHTRVWPRLGKARGSSAWMISSLISRAFLPFRRRPVSFSILSSCASSSVFTTEPGTALVSVHSFRMIWPATFSASGALLSPRGGTQPALSGWEAPHSTKRPVSSRSSNWASVGCSHWSIWKTSAFLNMGLGCGFQAFGSGPAGGVWEEEGPDLRRPRVQLGV